MRLVAGPAGELMPSPDSQAAITGPTSKREGGEEREMIGRGEEERNREGKSGRHGEYISILDLSIDGPTV